MFIVGVASIPLLDVAAELFTSALIDLMSGTGPNPVLRLVQNVLMLVSSCLLTFVSARVVLYNRRPTELMIAIVCLPAYAPMFLAPLK